MVTRMGLMNLIHKSFVIAANGEHAMQLPVTNKSAHHLWNSGRHVVSVFIVLLLSWCLSPVSDGFAAGGELKFPAAIDAPRPGKQEAVATVADTSGNLYITGYQNLGAGTDDDYLTVKFNSDGTVAWRRTYNRSGGSDQATAIALDSSKNVVVTGYAWNGTDYDIYTAKYRGSDGTILWEHTYNAPAGGNDLPVGIAIDNLDNAYVGGYVQTASAQEDYLVLKYGVDGPTTELNPVWVATWNGTSNGVDKMSAISVGSSGIAVTGQSWNGTDFDVASVLFNVSNGTKVWDRRYTSAGQNPDIGRKVQVDGNGNVIITASVTNSGNLDMYTAKYAAATGAVLWEKTYNGASNSDDEPKSVILDASGNVYVTGYSYSLVGHEDVLVIRYAAANGNKDWEKVYDSGASSTDIGTALVLDAAQNVFVTGYSVGAGGNTNIVVLKIKNDPANPALFWNTTFDGVAGKNDKPAGMGLGAAGEILVGGWSDSWTAGATDYDYLMLAFDPGLLNPPSAVTATLLSNTSVTISWADNSSNEDGFRIDRKLTELGQWVENVGTVGANETSFTDSGLTSNSTYYYRVRSYNAASGSSNPSPEVRVITLYVTYKNPIWSYIYNSPDSMDDYPAGIAAGPDNHPVVTGYSLMAVSGFDYYTIKLDGSTGSILWNDRYNDADDQLDRATSVAVDSSNAAIVTGYSSLYFAPAGDNINSIYTVKYPASCTPPLPCTPATIWTSQYNGPGGIDDRATAVATAIDATNNVVVTGYGKNAAGNEDIYLIKYAANPAVDAFGKAIPDWSAVPYNGVDNGDDIPSGVAFDRDGNVFVAGFVQVSSSPVTYQGYAAKYCGKAGALCNGKQPGEIIWQHSFAGAGDGRFRSLAVDLAGNLYTAGYDTGTNGQDLLLVKFDGAAVPSGSRVLWSRTIDGPTHGDDSAIAIKYDQIDDSVVAGGTVLTTTGNHDLFIVRFDSAGNEIWRRTHLRVGTDEEAMDMAMDVSGNISIVGYTSDGGSADAISVGYDYMGTLIGATVYQGAANNYDEATVVTFNPRGDTLVAGYSVNAQGNADYLVYKDTGLSLQASAPFTATQYYTKVDLSWTDTSNGETGFYLERKTGACASANPWTLIYTAPANTTTYSNTGLNAGQEYCYRVRSFKSGEIDPRWIERYVRLDNPVPPSNVIATPVNTTKIDLTWQDTTTGETGIRIFRCSGVGCSNFTELTTVAANVVTYSDTSVSQGTSYSYRVMASKTGDWASAYSLTATATTPSPAAPAALAASRVSEGQIDLSWSDSTNDETGFKIERCEAASCTFSQIATVAANATTFSDTLSLKANTTYRYQVRAYKTATASWDGPYSTSAEAVTTMTPVSGLTASAINSTSIKLTWTDPTSTETGFKIERCSGSSCSDFSEVGQTVAGSTSWIDTGVCNGSPYSYRVSAIRTGLTMTGNGAWTRRKPLTISNFAPNAAMKLVITYDSDMKSNFDDIRFFDESTKWEIPYFLESKTDSTTATVWIKTGNNNTISLYYGNAAAGSGSNGAMVFDLFDDFDSLANWSVVGGTVSASSGIATIDTVGSATLYRNYNFPYPYIAETRYQYQTPNSYRNRLAITTSAGTGSPTGFDYGLFSNGTNHQLYWNGWTGTALTINTWYVLQWDVTDTDYSFRIFDTAWNQLATRSTGAKINDLKRAYFTGGESDSSDFKLDWFRIRKPVSPVPTAAIGSEEQSGGYVFPVTWNGDPSSVASTTTPVPAVPTSPSALRVSEARIDIGWSDANSDESGFKIDRCAGALCSDFAEIGSVSAGISTFSDTTPMTVNTTYRYQVRAYKNATCSGGWNTAPTAPVSADSTLVVPTLQSVAGSVGTLCEDLRFTDTNGTSILNHWVESGCGSATTSAWVKIPSLPSGTRTLYMNWANTTSQSTSSAASVFDFFEDFSGTLIDSGRWVKSDNGGYLSQNNELISSGGSGAWGSSTMYSSSNFARPFVLEMKHKATAGNYLMFGVKDTSTNATYPSYHYAAYPVSGTDLQVYESGSGRGSNLASIALNVNEYYKFEVLGTGAKYYVGTSPDSYTLFYTSNYSTTSPLKIGFDNHNMSFRFDDVRIRKYAATVPTSSIGSYESGTYSLLGGTWYARRPITITNGGSALTDYQVKLTVDTTALASNRVTVSWTDTTASETGFIVERCTGNSCDFSVIDSFTAAANSTSFIDRTVVAGNSYCYRVKADRSGVWTSDPSSSLCASIGSVAAPVLTVTATTSNALSWTDTTSGEDAFVIERCAGVSCDFSTLDDGFPVVVNSNATSYTDTSVCGPLFRYRVKSIKFGPAGWDNIYSNTVDATTALPAAPGAFSVTRVSELQINLTWSDNTTDESGFRIERCTGSSCSDFSQIAEVSANATTFSDYGRLPNTVYRYRVRAYKDGVCGWDTSYTGESEATSSVLAPSPMSATAPLSTQVSLNWTDATLSETAFRIERCETSSCSYSELARTGMNDISYTDNSVCSGVGYTYRVQALSEGGTNSGGGTWTRRKPVTVANFKQNFLVRLTVPYEAPMNTAFDDIRFVDTTNGIELPYWIESKTNGSTANVWIRTSTGSSIFMYYGNSAATSSSSVTPVFGAGLMAYYPFNENDGTLSGTTSDASGNGNALTLNNFTSGFGVKSGGVYGNALSLNGSSNATKDAPVVPTGNVATIEAWIYPKSYADATYNGIVSWSNRACNGLGIALSIQNNGRLSMPTWCNDFVPTSGGTAVLNSWNHVAAVVNGTTASLYTNGQLVGTTTLGAISLNSINLAIGSLDYPAGRYFNGLIDEVRIFNRALSAQEIAGRYAVTLPTATIGASETISTTSTYSFTYASAFATATVTPPALATPTSFTATRGSESHINLSWVDAVNGETGFEIDRCIGVGCDFSTKTTISVAAGATTYSDIGLIPNTRYRYKIRSKRASTCTAYSTDSVIREADTSLTAPGTPTTSAPSTTQINLSWSDTTASDTGFIVERCAGSGCTTGFSAIGTNANSITSFADTTVCPNSTYGYRVAAINNGLSLNGGGVWTRRKELTVSNFQPDFQTRVVVAYDADMNADFSDLRFFDPVANKELPYWIESKSDSSTATVWLKSRVSSTIHMYYGNPAATGMTNGSATFEFFDSFSGTTIDSSKWVTVNGGYFSQNEQLISSGGSGGWNSGMYSVANFTRPFVYEVDFLSTSGAYMMLGIKGSNTYIDYPYFTYAAYPAYDVNGNRLLVYEDGNGRGDNLKAITRSSWQYFKFEVKSAGAEYYQGTVPGTFTNYYSSTYSTGTPLKIGFTTANQAFKMDNARVRKYANPEPSVVVGAEEQSAGYAFAGTYVSGYSAIAYRTTPLPVAPTTLTVVQSATTDVAVSLTWSDLSNDETSFRVERCTGASCSSFSEIGTVASNSTAVTDSSLGASTTYCYRVRADKTAFCSTGWPTAYTNTACEQTFAARTDSFVATATGPFSIRLNWNDLAVDENGYLIQVQAWNGTWVDVVRTAANVNTYLDTIAIEPQKTYSYRIRPYRGADDTPFVISNPVTTPAYSQGQGTCP